MLNKQNKVTASLAIVSAMLLTYWPLQYFFGVLNQAYFWDELGVYSRSSMYLFEHGLSLLPSAVPDELSRGHPLLCPFYFGLAFKLFGCNPSVAHLAAACLNLLGFYALFQLLLLQLKPYLAAFCTWAIFVQALFLSQSTLVLPEMPLMVCSIFAVTLYLKQHFKWSMLCILLALQIKESALVLPIAFGLAESLANKKIWTKNHVYLFLLPVVSFIAFVVVQKIQRGYFFYPLHTSLASSDPYYIKERWDDFFDFFLCQEGHFPFVIACAISFLLALIINIKHLANMLFSRQVVMPLIIVGSLCFLVLNYYLSRYTLYFMVFVYVLFFFSLAKIFKQRQWPIACLAMILAVWGIFNWNPNKDYTDVNFTYSQHIKSLQMTFKVLEDTEYDQKNIGFNFPCSAVFWGRNNGYTFKQHFNCVNTYDTSQIKDYIVLTHPGDMADTATIQSNYTLQKELRSGYAYCRIYKKL